MVGKMLYSIAPKRRRRLRREEEKSPMKMWRFKAISAFLGVLVLAGLSLRMIIAQSSIAQEGASASAKAEVLPKDVYPDSRNRIPLVKREDLDEKRKKAYDAAFAKTNSIAGLQGVAGILLHSVTDDVRFESPLGRRLTELAIITAARESEQNFEW